MTVADDAVKVLTVDDVRVDYATSDAFAAVLETAIGDGTQPLVIDLSRLSRIGSIGMRALIEAAKKTQAPLSLAAPQPLVRETLAIARLDVVVPIFETVAEASAAALRA